jgi:hypothetical protein
LVLATERRPIAQKKENRSLIVDYRDLITPILTTLDHFRDNAFCSAALATKFEFSSSAITIDLHLLDPDVDRSMAEFKECRLA